MTKEQELLLEVLAHSINGNTLTVKCEDIDWVDFIKESVSQTVSVCCFDSVTPVKEKIPEDIYKKWFNHSCGSMAINSFVEKSQKELVSLLEKGGYDYIIIKGLTAASYYEKPEMRMLGDVDFLIDPDKKEEIKELLKNEGFNVSHENHICHIVFTKPKAHLEMHFEISGMPEGEKAEKIRSFMSTALKEPSKKSVCGILFNAPQDKYHAVILLLHMQHHILGEGIGLRHLQDWACFVGKTSKEEFWKSELIPLLKEIGLFTFMNTMTAVCVKYFKITAPDWCEAVEESLCEEIIEDILSGGNFGKKDKMRSSTAMGMVNKDNRGRLKSAFKTLKSSTEDLYPVVKKYKVLYPFIYFYRIVKYAFFLITGKRVSFSKTIPLAEKRRALYNKLHIYEVKGNE